MTGRFQNAAGQTHTCVDQKQGRPVTRSSSSCSSSSSSSSVDRWCMWWAGMANSSRVDTHMLPPKQQCTASSTEQCVLVCECGRERESERERSGGRDSKGQPKKGCLLAYTPCGQSLSLGVTGVLESASPCLQQGVSGMQGATSCAQVWAGAGAGAAGRHDVHAACALWVGASWQAGII